MVDKKMNFYDAKEYCYKKFNATLLSVETKHQNNFIRDYYSFFGSKWLSASLSSDKINNNILKWNGIYSIKYTNFDPFNSLSNASPSLGCLKILENGLWINSNCMIPSQFVCQKNLIQPIKSSIDCPKSWILFTLNNACFKIIKASSISEAGAQCQREAAIHGEEGFLASINSKEENEFVLKLSLKHSPHLHKILLGGIGGGEKKMNWVWVDGSDFSNYQNWNKYMPRQRQNMSSLVMLKSGKWANIRSNKNSHPHHTIAVCKLIFLI
uniref:C-type lectin domain-containing protein n=1 Tax=Strongyloides stercoralis TaxID=6248 RepID=A0A0K0ELM1_STRER